jgi:hypothetical protein
MISLSTNIFHSYINHVRFIFVQSITFNLVFPLIWPSLLMLLLINLALTMPTLPYGIAKVDYTNFSIFKIILLARLLITPLRHLLMNFFKIFAGYPLLD